MGYRSTFITDHWSTLEFSEEFVSKWEHRYRFGDRGNGTPISSRRQFKRSLDGFEEDLVAELRRLDWNYSLWGAWLHEDDGLVDRVIYNKVGITNVELSPFGYVQET